MKPTSSKMLAALACSVVPFALSSAATPQSSAFSPTDPLGKFVGSGTCTGEIMAMGIPLITNSGVGDVEMIVNRYRAGIIIERFTNEAYEQAAQQTVAGLVFDAAEIRRGATEFYSLDRAIEKYIQIYKSILG